MPIVNGIDILSTMNSKRSMARNFCQSDSEAHILYKDIPVFINPLNLRGFYYTFSHWSSSLVCHCFMGWRTVNIILKMMYLISLVPRIWPSISRKWSYSDRVKTKVKHLLIEGNDIRGLIHNHSTYSDGVTPWKKWRDAAQKRAKWVSCYFRPQHLCILCKWSEIDDVYRQWEEIEQLNKQFHGFLNPPRA